MSKELTKNDQNIYLQSYFQSIFEKFPELLCFLSEGVDATEDYEVTQMANWMLEMYQAAKNIPILLMNSKHLPFIHLL